MGTSRSPAAPASGDLFQIGLTTVECSATDVAGNTGTAGFGVTVVDTTAPALHLPADITMEATGPETLVDFSVTAVDAVTPDPTVTCTPMSGSGFTVGAHTVHCEATDTVGNTSTGDFSVTIQDTTAPELTLPSDDVLAEATGADGAAVTFEATASDLVDDDPSVSCDVPSGSTFSLGDTVVTCAASDDAGNRTETSFTVRVEDTTPPAIGALTGLSAEAVSAAGVELIYDTPGAVDVVDPDPSVACVPPSGSYLPVGREHCHLHRHRRCRQLFGGRLQCHGGRHHCATAEPA